MIKPLCMNLLLTLLMLSVAPARAEVELPSIGQPSDTTLSPAEEAEIGAEIVSQLRNFNFFLQDAELTYYLRDVGMRLAAHSGHSPNSFSFYVVRDNQVNAFALPGGHIGVNAGLILASESEDELAGVVAHEIAHVTQRHIARQVEASSRFNITTAAALLIAVLAGASDPDVVQAALTMGLATSAQQRINFTRAHEMEADRVGIRILAGAGYDPRGMAGFFQKMEERSRLYGSGLPEILRTHPVSNTRISEALSRIAQYDSQPITSQRLNREYRIMRARLRVLTATEASAAVDYFKAVNSDSTDPETTDEQVRLYGLALAQYRAGRFDVSIDILSELVDDYPDVVHYSIALADSLLARGRTQPALVIFERYRLRYPDYAPLTLAYAEALVQTGQPAQARAQLLGSGLIKLQEPELHRLLALAARDLKREAEAHYQMAEHHRLLREYPQALNQLDAGLRLDNLSNGDKARLMTAQQRVRKETPEALLKRYDRGERN